MSDTVKLKKQPSKNRIALSDECTNKISEWQSQIGQRFKGMTIKPVDLVEWVILCHSQMLSVQELQDIQKKYWDDIAMASWALRELKRAKASGMALSLHDILSDEQGSTGAASVSTKRKMGAEISASSYETLTKEKTDAKTGG